MAPVQMQEGGALLHFVILTFNFWLWSVPRWVIWAKQLTPHDLDLPRGWPCDLRRLWCNPLPLLRAALTFHPVIVFVSCVCSYLFVSVLLYLCSVCNLSVLRHFFCAASSSLACFFYSKELIRCQLLLLEFDCIWICKCFIISAFDQFVFACYQMPD